MALWQLTRSSVSWKIYDWIGKAAFPCLCLLRTRWWRCESESRRFVWMFISIRTYTIRRSNDYLQGYDAFPFSNNAANQSTIHTKAYLTHSLILGSTFLWIGKENQMEMSHLLNREKSKKQHMEEKSVQITRRCHGQRTTNFGMLSDENESLQLKSEKPLACSFSSSCYLGHSFSEKLRCIFRM